MTEDDRRTTWAYWRDFNNSQQILRGNQEPKKPTEAIALCNEGLGFAFDQPNMRFIFAIRGSNNITEQRNSKSPAPDIYDYDSALVADAAGSGGGQEWHQQC